MSTYQTVVVGVDGSASSLRAVARAAQIAGRADATLIVANAYLPAHADAHAADILKDEGYKLAGNAPVYAMLNDARILAKEAGASKVAERAIRGAAVDVLVDLANEVDADLLVVGSVGMGTLSGRLLGSVPSAVSRRAKTDVLIVHTT